MVEAEKCLETFLDGVSDLYLYTPKETVLPIPFNVGQLTEMNKCQLPKTLALHISTIENEDIVASSFTAKSSSSKATLGLLYTYDISVNVEKGYKKVPDIVKNVAHADFYVVLRRYDGSLLLCYTMPGTFSSNSVSSCSQTATEATISIKAQALSDFIKMDLL